MREEDPIKDKRHSRQCVRITLDCDERRQQSMGNPALVEGMMKESF